LPLCRARGFVGSYVGVDLLPEMIDAARARHGRDPQARFEVADALSPPDWLRGVRFDLVVACGALSLRVPSYDAYLDAALDALWALTEGALALVLPSARALRRVAGIGEDFVCHDPSALRARLLRLTPYLTLREDFLPTDLAAYLYRGRSVAHDALRPDLDGTQVMDHLGIEPGREIGQALDFLLELRLEEGPLGEEEAFRRLDAWWAART